MDRTDPEGVVTAADVALARGGDDAAFARLVAPLRRELHAHCYRMLGSTHDADDAVQDALLRAWRGVAGFEARGSIRSWLYTVATRTCLDALRGRSRRALPMDLGPASPQAVLADRPSGDIAWLEPYPDAGLGSAPVGPEARYEAREAVELAFVAAVSHLPGNQRAALLLFEVVGFTAAEIATMMDTSVASVNSALQRARAAVAGRIPAPRQQDTRQRLTDLRVRALADRYATALADGDARGLVSLLTEDVTWSMPPLPRWYAGIAAVTDFAVRVPLAGCGSWRRTAVSANGQPAFASYLWDSATGTHAAFAIDVLTLRDDRIAAVTTFIGAAHVARFGLPSQVD